MLLNANEKIRLIQLCPGALTDDLIEELFSMAGDTQRAEAPNGLDVTPASDGIVPITAKFNPGNTQVPLMQFQRGNSTLTFALNPDNSLSINLDGQPTTVAGGGGGGSGIGNAFPGQIVSYQGAGIYNVNVYKLGTSQAPTAINVRQLENDDANPIANGRWGYAVFAGNEWTMNIPTWG